MINSKSQKYKIMKKLYANPKYYEIAFSYRDIPAEVDVFEVAIRRFSGIVVKRVLEIGCGTCPHMEEVIKRGYEYTGIDSSEDMLNYSREKTSETGTSVQLVRANMVDFRLDMKVDFAYVMLGSLYVKNTDELISHFDSVSQALNNGGLYFLDWCIQFDSISLSSESWEIEREGVKVKTTCSQKTLNRVEQTFEETITLDIKEHREQKRIIEKSVKRAIYPQEFLRFIYWILGVI